MKLLSKRPTKRPIILIAAFLGAVLLAIIFLPSGPSDSPLTPIADGSASAFGVITGEEYSPETDLDSWNSPPDGRVWSELEDFEKAKLALLNPMFSPIEHLILGTKHTDWSVRWDFVDALGSRGDPRAVPALVERALRDDNPHPRWRSLWALSVIQPSGILAIPLLRESLSSEVPEEVFNGAVALAYFSDTQGLNQLIASLSDPDSFRRWQAVFSFRNLGEESAVPHLARLLDESAETDVSVRSEAVMALGEIGGEGAVSALRAAIRLDSSPNVRWRAAMMYGRLAGPAGQESLQQALAAERDAEVREAIENALAEIASAQVKESAPVNSR